MPVPLILIITWQYVKVHQQTERGTDERQSALTDWQSSIHLYLSSHLQKLKKSIKYYKWKKRKQERTSDKAGLYYRLGVQIDRLILCRRKKRHPFYFCDIFVRITDHLKCYPILLMFGRNLPRGICSMPASDYKPVKTGSFFYHSRTSYRGQWRSGRPQEGVKPAKWPTTVATPHFIATDQWPPSSPSPDLNPVGVVQARV